MRGRKENRTWICPICQQEFATRRLMYNHRKDVHPDGNPEYKIRQDYACKYCGGIINTTKQGICNHESMCIMNPNRVIHDRSFTHTQSFKEKCSKNMKRRLLSGEVLHTWNPPNKALSYAEQYFYDLLISKCGDTIQWKNNYRVGRYWLDFANLQSHTYFEVDGEQHYTEDGQLHDAKRTEWLTKHGWNLITRIRWKCFCILTTYEKDKYNNELINKFTQITICDENKHANIIQPLSPHSNVIRTRSKHTKSEWLHICKIKREQTLAAKLRAQSLKYNNARANGLIRRDGKINGKGIPKMLWKRRKDLILNSSVDLHKFGWVSNVAKETGLSKRVIENTVRRFPEVFCNKCFYRKGSMILQNHISRQ